MGLYVLYEICETLNRDSLFFTRVGLCYANFKGKNSRQLFRVVDGCYVVNRLIQLKYHKIQIRCKNTPQQIGDL